LKSAIALETLQQAKNHYLTAIFKPMKMASAAKMLPPKKGAESAGTNRVSTEVEHQ
jgi:hypothetical protein